MRIAAAFIVAGVLSLGASGGAWAQTATPAAAPKPAPAATGKPA